MLDTGEAYDMHMQDLIWAKAGLQVAIRMLYIEAESAPQGDTIRELQESYYTRKVVANCRRVLCGGYSSSYKAHRILMDRLHFNESKHILLNVSRNGDHADRYLKYLLCKSQVAASCSPDKGTASAEQSADPTHIAFQISDREFESSSIKEFELGVGSFSKSVCSALWLGQTRVAVKVLRIYNDQPNAKVEEAGELESEFSSGDAVTAVHNPYTMFKEEVSLLARLQSPYIVRLIGWASDMDKKEGKIVMELAETDLARELLAPETRKGFPLHVAVDMMLQVSKGMQYVHSQNVIHRDIKPSNILLNRSPIREFWRVKICDFGISRMKPHQDALYSTFKVGTSYLRFNRSKPNIATKRTFTALPL